MKTEFQDKYIYTWRFIYTCILFITVNIDVNKIEKVEIHYISMKAS